MRVLFTTFAAKVHMYSQVPLAWALHTAGHEVRIASQPDLADDITHTGLTAVPVGPALNLEEGMRQTEEGLAGEEPPEAEDDGGGLDLTETRAELLTPDYLLGTFTAMTAVVFQNQCPDPMVDDLVRFARDWRPDLVVWDTMTFAGPVAARAVGAAHCRLLFGLDHVARMRELFTEHLGRLPRERRDDPLGEWLDRLLDRYGITGGFAEEMVLGQWTVDPTPAWMRFPSRRPYVPMRYVPYNGPSRVPEWLRERPKRRRVCLSLGLSHREVQGGDEVSIRDLLEALADLDVEVVATLDTRQLASMPTLPANVRAVDFVPLNALLPTCSALISHGGSGTMSTALARGVPQLVVPSKIWDSADKARRLAEQGAGICLTEVTASAVRESVVALLEQPSYAENAARLRREAVATPSPVEVVPLLERLTAEHRRHRPAVRPS
ncbi:activator-dependent family glycosyltransferase [Micromonospora sp. BRA006-A]|uniref:activator-dependent family glycosyltransferase n=1 Tax=Micromonospora sp. BRA006-A TaxID=2962860 RepID=UPI00296FEBCB|nr:activator-dependent family glycosyltransferase [Micromonospora sp. BRA006-A]MDW3848644.1 activator-dependent family glycosyltransferase [Micromonospora sp. BRA006-A]